MRQFPIQPVPMPPEERGKSGRRSDHGGRGTILSPAQWLKQHVLAQEEEAISSLGELLLPTLLGTMEACWVDAALIGLASAGLLSFSTPLLPLWAPFVYIIGFHWLLVFREGRAAAAREADQADGTSKTENTNSKISVSIPDAPLLFIVLAVLSLFIIWLQIYSPGKALYDLTWLATLGSDTLFLNLHFYQAFFIVALSCYLCWRGLRLFDRTVEPSHVIRMLLLGLGVIIATILLRAAILSAGAATVGGETIFLFLLIPFYLALSLAAHALARIAFVRRFHLSGLQGSVVAQERAVVTVIASLGLILLLVTALIGLFADPSFFAGALRLLIPAGQAIVAAYNWLVGIFAYILVFLVTPIFWLSSWIGSLLPHRKLNTQSQQGKLPTKKPVVHPPANITASWLPYLRAGVLVLLLMALVFLVWWALRKRRRAAVRIQRKDGDIHESLWSWLLLWNQLKGILRAMLGRFFRKAPHEEQLQGAQNAQELAASSPAARTVREIYRALLKKAASRGYPRRKHETPLELRQRLDEGVPLVEPQLESITEAYSQVRYGGDLPDTDEVMVVQRQWRELDQKWG
jgi:hypothetical protein